MDYNTSANLGACLAVVRDASRLLYYSHIPTAAISLLIGFFVFIKSKKALVGKILLAISISFSLWCALDLVIWLNYDKNSIVMFSWALIELCDVAFYILSLYFIYVFIDRGERFFPKENHVGMFSGASYPADVN